MLYTIVACTNTTRACTCRVWFRYRAFGLSLTHPPSEADSSEGGSASTVTAAPRRGNGSLISMYSQPSGWDATIWYRSASCSKQLSWYIKKCCLLMLHTGAYVHIFRILHCFSRCRTAPRCGFSIFEITRCGAVRCLFFENLTLRCGFSPWWCGAVRIMLFKNRTVRCGAVIRRAVFSYGAVERAPQLKKTVYRRSKTAATPQKKLTVRDFLPNVKEILYMHHVALH